MKKISIFKTFLIYALSLFFNVILISMLGYLIDILGNKYSFNTFFHMYQVNIPLLMVAFNISEFFLMVKEAGIIETLSEVFYSIISYFIWVLGLKIAIMFHFTKQKLVISNQFSFLKVFLYYVGISLLSGLFLNLSPISRLTHPLGPIGLFLYTTLIMSLSWIPLYYWYLNRALKLGTLTRINLIKEKEAS